MHHQKSKGDPESDLTPYLAWFEAYTAAYLNGSPEETVAIKLKIDHSLQVLENGGRIAHSLGLGGLDRLTADIAALFHDVGRFPQFARYKTFKDGDSANHGLLGSKTLAVQPVLHALPKSNRKLIIGAVYCHNMKTLPRNLPARLDRLVRIVRDADKLDILNVLLEHVQPGGHRNEKVTLSLADDPNAYSPEIIDQVKTRQPVSYDNMTYINDMVLSLCGWIYDLNFKASFQILQERGYLPTLMSFLPQTREVVLLRLDMDTYLANRRL